MVPSINPAPPKSRSNSQIRLRRKTLADDDLISLNETLHPGIDRRLSVTRRESDPPTQEEINDALEEATLSGRTYVNHNFHYLRFFVVMLGGIMFGNVIVMRYSIAISILRMVNQTAIAIKTHPNSTRIFRNPNEPEGEFVWDNEIQQAIMSIYMIAYTLPQIPVTKLGLMVGTRLSVTASVLLCNISTLVTPIVAYWGWQWVVVLRLLNGLGAAGVLSWLIDMMEKWLPYNQQSLGLTCSQIPTSVLTTINPLVTGYLAAIHWKYAFYVTSTVGIVACLVFFVVTSDRPETNWLISEKELRLIRRKNRDEDAKDAKDAQDAQDAKDAKNAMESKAEVTKQVANGHNKSSEVAVNIPDEPPTQVDMFDVMRLPCFYAYALLKIIYCSAYAGFNFVLPLYLQNILLISIHQTGFYCFIIQAGNLISMVWPHVVVTFLNTRCGFSLTVSRRIGYGLLCFMVGITWLNVGIFHKFQIALLFINRCFHGSNIIFLTSTLMSNFAKVGLSSMTFSVFNTIGNLSTVATSMLIGHSLDKSGQSRSCWTWIFAGLASSQLAAFSLYSTVIRSGPIHFSARKDTKEKGPRPANAESLNDCNGSVAKA